MTFDGISRPEGKLVSESQVTMARQMMPDDANPWGYVHGGVVMKMVDECAGSSATRHARCRVATVAIDYMSFLHPVHVGDLLTLKASVNDVGRTSMEVGVRVETENMMTGERRHTSSAYVVMVALDGDGDTRRDSSYGGGEDPAIATQTTGACVEGKRRRAGRSRGRT
jgi:acyl-CoA hydrolase